MVKYTLVERPNRDLVVGGTIRVLGSTGKEGEMPEYKGLTINWAENGLSELAGEYSMFYDAQFKKEEDMSSNFENLKTVFDLEYEDAEEFWTDLARAAEGIRQHEALHRIDDAFGLNLAAVLLVGESEEPEDELAKKRSDKVTTIIGDKSDE